MEGKKSDKRKILAIALIIVGALVAIVGLVIEFSGKIGMPNIVSKEDTADSILNKLSIDNYLKFALEPDIDIGKNILDINSDENMMLYFYSNSNIKHYKLQFPSGTDEGMVTFVYARYDEYTDEHQKVFGVKPTLVLDGTDLRLTDLVQISGDDYKINSGDVALCDENEPTECYIMLAKYFDNTNNIEFSNLIMKNNVISGDVKVNSVDGLSLDATFEFEYEPDGDGYIAKGLIIKSINDSSNGI